MLQDFSLTLYDAKILEVNDDKIDVEIPSLGIEKLSVFHALTFGYLESKSGNLLQLPKKDDQALITFLGGEYHNPILVLGQVVKLTELKEKNQKIQTQVLEILPEEGKTTGSVTIDYTNKKIEAKSDKVTVTIDLGSGTVEFNGMGSGTISALVKEQFLQLYDQQVHLGNLGYPTGPTLIPLSSPPTVTPLITKTTKSN